MKCLSVVGLRVGVQGSIRKVGPGSSRDRTLGHIVTTVTLFVPHQPHYTGKAWSDPVESAGERKGVGFMPDNFSFTLEGF